MKKTKYLLFAVMVLCFAAFAAGCNEPEPEPEPEDTVTYTIEGAQDCYFKISDISFDFSMGVTVQGSDGSTPTVAVDASKVVFGTAGVYDVVYSYDKISVTKKVYVLGLPTLKAAEGTGEIESEYAEVQSKLYEGLVAKDSLGETLDVAVVEGTENPIYDSRGIPQYGAHDVTYSVTDRVGQTTEFTRTFTIKTGEDTPIVSGTPSADVADETAVFDIDLKGNEVSALYIGDKQFNELTVDSETGKLSAAVVDLLDVYAIGSYDATIMTNGGYVDFTFEVTDKKPIELGYFGLNNWTYETGIASFFPVPTKEKPRQDVNFSYVLKKDTAEVLTSADGNFTAPVAGVYALTVTGTRASTDDSLEKVLSIYVLSAEEYASTLVRGDSLQDGQTLSFSYKTVEQNGERLSDCGYTEEEEIGPAYKMHTAEGAGGGDQCQAFVLSGSSTDFGGSNIDTKYNTVTFDLYYAEVGNKFPWVKLITGLNASDGYLRTNVTNRPTPGNDNIADVRYVRVYEVNADGTRGRITNPTAGGWYRYEVSLAEYRGAATPFLWLGNEYGGSFYVRRVALSEAEVDGDVLPVLNNGCAASFGMNADAASYWSSNVTVTENQSIGGRPGAVALTHTLADPGDANIGRGLALSFGVSNGNGSTGDSMVPDGFKMLTFNFYAEAGADIRFYYGHDGSKHVFESAATSDKFCIYDTAGNRIASPLADGWYTAKVDLAPYYACATTGSYGRMGILEYRTEHVIAIDPQTAFYTKEAFVAGETPELPMSATNNELGTGYDNDGSWKAWITFARNQELGGRTGVSTLTHDKNISSGSNDMRGLIMGIGVANTNDNYGPDRVVDSEVSGVYRKLTFALYCEAGAELWFHYGYDTDFRFASAASEYFCVYDADGNRIAVPKVSGWYRAEVDLAPFFACKAGEYGRMGILDNKANHTIGIDPQTLYFSTKVFEATEARLNIADNGNSFGVGYDNDGSWVSWVTFARDQTVGERTGVVTLTHDKHITGNPPDMRGLIMGIGNAEPRDNFHPERVSDSNVPADFRTLIFDFYCEAGAELWFHYGHDGNSFLFERAADSEYFGLFTTDGTRVIEVTSSGWYTVRVDLTLYYQCASGEYGRMGILDNTAGNMIAADPLTAYYSTAAF